MDRLPSSLDASRDRNQILDRDSATDGQQRHYDCRRQAMVLSRPLANARGYRTCDLLSTTAELCICRWIVVERRKKKATSRALKIRCVYATLALNNQEASVDAAHGYPFHVSYWIQYSSSCSLRWCKFLGQHSCNEVYISTFDFVLREKVSINLCYPKRSPFQEPNYVACSIPTACLERHADMTEKMRRLLRFLKSSVTRFLSLHQSLQLSHS